jgi:hypothetical protein
MAWDELTPEQQAERARGMEIYAGMIEHLDEQIGNLIRHLQDSGTYDNTLIPGKSGGLPMVWTRTGKAIGKCLGLQRHLAMVTGSYMTS